MTEIILLGSDSNATMASSWKELVLLKSEGKNLKLVYKKTSSELTQVIYESEPIKTSGGVAALDECESFGAPVDLAAVIEKLVLIRQINPNLADEISTHYRREYE